MLLLLLLLLATGAADAAAARSEDDDIDEEGGWSDCEMLEPALPARRGVKAEPPARAKRTLAHALRCGGCRKTPGDVLKCIEHDSFLSLVNSLLGDASLQWNAGSLGEKEQRAAKVIPWFEYAGPCPIGEWCLDCGNYAGTYGMDWAELKTKLRSDIDFKQEWDSGKDISGSLSP